MTYSAPHAGLVKAIVSFSQSLRSSTRNNDFYFHFFTRRWGFKESRETWLYATVKYYLWSGNVLIEVCFVEMNVFLVKDDIFLYSP